MVLVEQNCYVEVAPGDVQCRAAVQCARMQMCGVEQRRSGCEWCCSCKCAKAAIVVARGGSSSEL